MSLSVYEIQTTISGEVGAVPAGTATLLVRLAGCNLKCPYCDAVTAQDVRNATRKFSKSEFYQITEHMESRGISHILITGGEPLLHAEDVIEFINDLPPHIFVTVETNGTIAPDVIRTLLHNNVVFVVDIKNDFVAQALLFWLYHALSHESGEHFTVIFKAVCSFKEDIVWTYVLLNKLLEDLFCNNNLHLKNSLFKLRLFFSPVTDCGIYNKQVVEAILGECVQGKEFFACGNSIAVQLGLNVQLHKLLSKSVDGCIIP